EREGRIVEVSGAPPAPATRQVRDPVTRCVLVVDDEPPVLEVTARILIDAGYVVVEASQAREALRLLELGEPAIDLGLTDLVMPETDGHTLGRLIAERHSGLPVAYMSGYPTDDVFHRGSPGASLPFLLKPFSPEALVALVQQLLAAKGKDNQATRPPESQGQAELGYA